MQKQKIILMCLRFVMSFIFLWAFFDKCFGLGFSTLKDKAWINGISPTNGFLSMATKGPFVNIFHAIAQVPGLDFIFMLGLLFIGTTLLLNKFLKWGCLAGIIMLFLMYLSLLFPTTNPFIDEHIVYILVLMLIMFENRV